MKKEPFVTLEKLNEITEKFPTPFHLYDEKGIRENAKALKEAFAWNKGFKEFFAVKATPNPYLINILQEYGCGCDCSSETELMMAKAVGCKKGDIMFSSNDTPEKEFRYADEIGGIINLDDITHIESVEKALGKIPEVISCRYNPGGVFKISNGIMDNPGDAKYGMTTEQIFDAFRILTSVMQFAMLPLQGLGQGAQPIISYNYGARNEKRVRSTFKLLIKTSVSYSVILWLIIMIFPQIFAGMFTSDSTLLAFTKTALRIYMAVVFIFGIQIACQMTFISLGRAKDSIIVAIVRKFILVIPLIYILPNIFRADRTNAVYMAEPVADILAVTFTAILFFFEFRKALAEISDSWKL